MLSLDHIRRKNCEFLLFYRVHKHLAAEGFISNLPADTQKSSSSKSDLFLIAAVFCSTLKQRKAQTPYLVKTNKFESYFYSCFSELTHTNQTFRDA